MPDASDILKDPTAMLTQALDPDVNSDHRLALFMALHRHKWAGGALPAQERGEGTAVAALAKDAEDNAAILERCFRSPKVRQTDARSGPRRHRGGLTCGIA